MEIIAPILTKIANKMLDGKSMKTMNKSKITLIEKKNKNKLKIENLRPISLLELHRKIITNTMNRRLNNLFLNNQKLIESNQSSLINRNIKNNIMALHLLSQIALTKYKKKNTLNKFKGVCLDFAKAFDRINHQYILTILKKKGFGKNFINFIKVNLKSEVKIEINGYLSETFTTTRGVPQGDCLSPILFVIGLNQLLFNINNDKSIKGLSKYKIKLLAHADDIMILSNNKKDIDKMMKWIEIYENVSNAKLNRSKTEELNFDINEKKSSNPIRYLGVMFNNKGAYNNIDEIIQKIIITLEAAKKFHQPLEGRINSFKSYAFSKFSFIATFITPTKKQMKEIKKICSWFLYSKENKYEPNKIYKNKISWERAKRTKKKGGFNLLINEEYFNIQKSIAVIKAIKTKLIYSNSLKTLLDLEYINNNHIMHPKSISKEYYNKIKYYKNKWVHQTMKIYNKIPKKIIYTNKEKLSINNSISSTDFPKKSRINRKGEIVFHKSSLNEWTKTKINFEINSKNDKIKTKDLMKILQKQIPIILTNKQKRWKEEGTMEPLKLLNFKIQTRPAIVDFKNRIARNALGTFDNCTLCGNKLDSIHLFLRCKITKLWEFKLGFKDEYEERTNNCFLLTKQNDNNKFKMNSYWITNWAIWKTYNFINHNEIKEEQIVHKLRNCIRTEEHRFLLNIINKQKTNKISDENLIKITSRLRYRTIEEGKIRAK